ncbi:MAG: nitroreductase family protein [Desulfamplus sp.]|nr:nitroreductase family protein [Desulfamplus sp.]
MFFSLIEKRRSIRKFKSLPIEKEKIDRIIEAALRSPSSRGFNPWRFIVVDRPELLESLSKAKPHGATFLKDAPLGVVVCGDESKTDVWVEDTSIATIFIQLAAHSLGIGSCWIQIRNREHTQDKTAELYIREILNIPENFRVESMIAIGYPNEDKKPHPKESLEISKVFWNSFEK